MRRTDRLFEILQLFRERGFTRAADLAERLEVSTRTIYRDIDTLIASGHPIEGERGVGYILREPIFLPPLSLTAEEASALRLGMDLIGALSDGPLSAPAQSVLRKLSPEHRASGISHYSDPTPLARIALLRDAVERREQLRLIYVSLEGVETRRTVRPLQLEHWQQVWTLTSWCETRADFRSFRVDRIETVEATGLIFDYEPSKSYKTYVEQMRQSA
jgi:predicted DNA-binding transcriptional regulator YafY